MTSPLFKNVHNVKNIISSSFDMFRYFYLSPKYFFDCVVAVLYGLLNKNVSSKIALDVELVFLYWILVGIFLLFVYIIFRIFF